MRRENRRNEKVKNDKLITYFIIIGVAITIVMIGLVLYSKELSNDVKQGTLNIEEMANIANSIENLESASTDIGKSIEESKNEMNTTNNTSVGDSQNEKNSVNISTNRIAINTSNITNSDVDKNIKTKSDSKTDIKKNTVDVTNSNVEKEELSFSIPVEGEISKQYAKDNLVYSETLKEWTTHMGIDIKAEKTTIVKAAERGTVKSIKNDPRYGLTVIIDHGEGFQTIYANLLTSEFVVEGENVEKGQSLGTVGNTAVFEIADEPHLHFEILKDSVQVDPNLYIK